MSRLTDENLKAILDLIEFAQSDLVTAMETFASIRTALQGEASHRLGLPDPDATG